MLKIKKKALQCLLGRFCLVAGLGAATSVLAADTLIVNQYMKPNQYLTSANGEYRLTFQSDGNLVLQRQSDLAQMWTSNTANQNGKRLVLGWDGNLTLQSHSKSPAWTSNTRGSRVNRLKLHDDGTLAIYDTANKQIWATDTATRNVTTLATTVTNVGSTNTYASSGSTMSIARSASTQVGDLMILAIQTATGVVPREASSSGEWTRFASCGVAANTSTACSTTGSDMGISLFYNYAGSAGAKSYTINKTANEYTSAGIMVVRGTATSSPIQSVGYFLDDGLNTQTRCKALPGLAGALAVCALSHDDAQPLTTPSGWGLRTSVVRSDSALFLYSRSMTSTALGETLISYNGDPIPPEPNQDGNGINISFLIKPKP